MTELILHHYDTSPFSEKVRLIFGAKRLAWRSVDIPRVMPKPDVIALTGGYRKTPILQIGADIYCDTALIVKVLDRLAPAPPLFPATVGASAFALAQWADATLFSAAVRHVFQPGNLGHMFAGAPAELDALVKDRQAMRATSTVRRLSELEATAIVESFLSQFERQLASGSKFAAGVELSIADFSVYHCLWYLQRAPGSAKLIAPYGRVLEWMAQIAKLGHGDPTPLSSAEAIEIARRSEPRTIAHPQGASGTAVGDAVEVLPTDYGMDPSAGALAHCDADEFAIRRTDTRAGEVIVHFPRLNYELRKR